MRVSNQKRGPSAGKLVGTYKRSQGSLKIRKNRVKVERKGVLRSALGTKSTKRKPPNICIDGSGLDKNVPPLGREAIKTFRQELNKRNAGFDKVKSASWLDAFVRELKRSGQDSFFPVEMVEHYLASQRKVGAFAGSLVVG